MLLIDGRCIFVKLAIVLLPTDNSTATTSVHILFQHEIVVHRTGAAEATTTTVYRRLILRLASTVIEVVNVLADLVEATIAVHILVAHVTIVVAGIHDESVVLYITIRIATCWTYQDLLLLLLLLVLLLVWHVLDVTWSVAIKLLM